MPKNIFPMILAAGVLCAPASAASHAPRAVPMLSGRYVYSASENCPSGGGTLHQLSGTISFDPATGKAKLNVYVVTGDKPEILGIRSTDTYSNTDALLTLGPTSYHIAYGPVEGGVATYASFVGLVQDGEANCGYLGTLARR